MNDKGSGGSILRYEDGEVIFEENSIGNEIYIIEDGKVAIGRRVGDRNTTLAVLGKGDLFGERAVFSSTPRAETAVAVGKTRLMPFSVEEVLQRVQTDRQFAITLLQALASRLRNANSTLLFLRILIDRSFGDGFIEGFSPENLPVRVGEILMEMGCLTRLQLDRTLRRQKESSRLEGKAKLLGEIMVESGIITDQQLISALAEQGIRLRRRPKEY
jgi:CRP-like cAMP-binding protein